MKQTHLMVATLGILVAGCGGGSDSVPVDAAPTISAIADQSTMANQPSNAIDFSVTDEQLAGLSITANSDRQDVVPDDSLELGGSGTMRTLTVTPAADLLGDAFITIVVTDTAGMSAASSFLLTIDPQQLSIRDFVRSAFMTAKTDDPALINAVLFDQDAGSDDFADLLAQ